MTEETPGTVVVAVLTGFKEIRSVLNYQTVLLAAIAAMLGVRLAVPLP